METDNQADSPAASSPPGPLDPAARRRLVVAGATARAMAESAGRLGLQVHAVDLFGDRDLRRVAHEVRLAIPYPGGLPDLVATFPPGPWLYTGALENHPDVIAAISRSRPLAGASAAAVRLIRDHARLRDLTMAAGLAFPETRLDPADLPLDGSWLVKPQQSAGGQGIERWRGRADGVPAVDRLVWQRASAGRPWSAAFLVTPAGASLVGASRQLIGRPWAGTKPFRWSGGVDVDLATLGPVVRQALDRLGDALTSVSELVGLVGVDFLVDRQNGVTVLEVNPRPTSSMELVERATGFSLANAQLAACGFPPLQPAPRIRSRRRTWAKAILFAPRPLSVDDRVRVTIDTLADRWSDQEGWPALADLPLPPQTIPAGRPVCTVFAAGSTPVAALRSLRRRVPLLSRFLFR